MRTKPFILTIASLVFAGLVWASAASAHCDSLDGPVAKAAVKSLKTGDFSHVQIWVGQEQEQELRDAYQRAKPAFEKGESARKLARRYFIESAIRLHRTAENQPYTGVKPADTPLPEDVEAAEKALKTGDIDPALDILNQAMRDEVSHWFQNALEARQDKNKSVEAGREWTDAYVKYVIYVHKLYKTIKAGPPHGVGE